MARGRGHPEFVAGLGLEHTGLEAPEQAEQFYPNPVNNHIARARVSGALCSGFYKNTHRLRQGVRRRPPSSLPRCMPSCITCHTSHQEGDSAFLPLGSPMTCFASDQQKAVK